MIQRVDLLIKEIRRKKLISRTNKGKMEKSYSQTFLNIYEREIDVYDIKGVLDAVKQGSPELVTIEVLRKEVIDAIEMLYEYHNSNNSVLEHDCCFEVYFDKIKMILDVMLTKEYIYTHRFGKG